MRILVFSHYYYPEGNAPASRMHAMCSRWVQQGHEVRVITCAPNVPSGIVYEGYKNRLWPQNEEIAGVKVKRVWTRLAANKGTLGRILNFVSYMVMAVLAARFMRRPDIIIATSPQFFCGWAGLIASKFRLRRVRFVLEIRDMWPDSIVAVGAMNNKRLLGILYKMEDWLYRGANHIVTVGQGYQQDLLDKGADAQKISIIPNGVDKELFYPQEPDQEYVEKYIGPDRFACAYIGTIGMAAGLDVAIRAGEILKERGRDDIRLIMVGDGAERENLEEELRQKELDNVLFTGRLAKEEVPKILSAVDSCLVHLKKKDLFKRVLPSKIFEMAAMKKPIILGVQGCAAELLQEAGAGICIEPENAEELVEAVCALADNPEQCARYGEDGREYVLKHYDRESLADEYIEVLKQVTS
ncbi:MAG: glycosyltransferase family 4 protein [Planctomycetia bacterium]|jgi:glycosyltransferase involved in cell wall biosynthesis